MKPPLREDLPLRHTDCAILSGLGHGKFPHFRLKCTGRNADPHPYMFYSEFNYIIAAIGAMDTDVISIETAHSRMELLEALSPYRYPAEIGPDIYDIHSPCVPSVEEMVDLLWAASKAISEGALWVNPDCGLKNRKWSETKAALINMVAAARYMRPQTNK